jgi:RNA polymerase sigma-70 factor (ECF subfamily)
VADGEELARVAARGDRRALERLLQDDHDRLHALCRRMCGNDADADDATQEALLAIVRGLPGWDGRSSYRTWSYRVATNACLDELRRRARRPRPVEVHVDVAAPGMGVDVAEQAVAAAEVDRLLRRLSDDHRAVVVLRDLCGLDYAELAEVLGVPVGTVRSRLARARGTLADAVVGNPRPGPERPRSSR